VESPSTAAEPRDVLPYYKELDSVDRVQAESLLTFVKAVIADSHTRIARLSQYQIVDIHSSNHYLFVQHPREVAAAMRTFLVRLRPRPSSNWRTIRRCAPGWSSWDAPR